MSRQDIACNVTDCRYNEEACHCGLDRILVCNCHRKTDDAEDASMCGSYRQKDN